MTDTVTVRYGRLVNGDAALRCRRCEGGGVERFRPEVICPRCDGSGVRADGWAYRDGGLALHVGDVVEVPPTPYSIPGGPNLATVVAIGSEFAEPHSRVLRVVESAALDGVAPPPSYQ